MILLPAGRALLVITVAVWVFCGPVATARAALEIRVQHTPEVIRVGVTDQIRYTVQLAASGQEERFSFGFQASSFGTWRGRPIEGSPLVFVGETLALTGGTLLGPARQVSGIPACAPGVPLTASTSSHVPGMCSCRRSHRRRDPGLRTHPTPSLARHLLWRHVPGGRPARVRAAQHARRLTARPGDRAACARPARRSHPLEQPAAIVDSVDRRRPRPSRTAHHDPRSDVADAAEGQGCRHGSRPVAVTIKSPDPQDRGAHRPPRTLRAPAAAARQTRRLPSRGVRAAQSRRSRWRLHVPARLPHPVGLFGWSIPEPSRTVVSTLPSRAATTRLGNCLR